MHSRTVCNVAEKIINYQLYNVNYFPVRFFISFSIIS